MKMLTFVLGYFPMMADIPWISWSLSCALICEKTAPQRLSLPTVDSGILTTRSGITLGRQETTWAARKGRMTMTMRITTRTGVAAGGGRNKARTTWHRITWARATTTTSPMSSTRMMSWRISAKSKSYVRSTYYASGCAYYRLLCPYRLEGLEVGC